MVKSTGRLLEVPVGEALLGRVVDPLGRPLDDAGPINTNTFRKVDDGNPTQGSFRAPATANTSCFGTAWVTNPPGANCEATTLF